MTKHIRTILCMVVLALTMVFASACSFFASETKQISRIYTIRDEEQKGMYIVIEYEGEEAEPDRFFVPDGATGEKGYGIARVDSMQNDQGGTTLYIYYEDGSKDATKVEIPAIGIQSINFETDPETEDISIVVTLSNGDVIKQKLLRGKDGKDGDTITGFSIRHNDDGTVYYDDDGRMHVQVIKRTYNEEEGRYVEEPDPNCEFPLPNGKEGNGIAEEGVKVVTYSHIESDSELLAQLNDDQKKNPDSYIFIEIDYTDGRKQIMTVQRQNQWYAREGWPASNLGNEGDFYYDTSNHRLFRKGLLGWGSPIAEFATATKKTHTVKLFADVGLKIGEYTILHGESFMSTTQGDTNIGTTLPKPEKQGYVFLGWYADDHYVEPESGEDYDPNAAHFTNLTPVTCDLILYARWSKEVA